MLLTWRRNVELAAEGVRRSARIAPLQGTHITSWALVTDSGLFPSIGTFGDCFDNASWKRSGPVCKSNC